jgi:hypothetical protein
VSFGVFLAMLFAAARGIVLFGERCDQGRQAAAAVIVVA